MRGQGQRVEVEPWLREWLAGQARGAFNGVNVDVRVEAERCLAASGCYRVLLRVPLPAGLEDVALAAARRLVERVTGRRLVWVPTPRGLRGYAGPRLVATIRLDDGGLLVSFHDY